MFGALVFGANMDAPEGAVTISMQAPMGILRTNAPEAAICNITGPCGFITAFAGAGIKITGPSSASALSAHGTFMSVISADLSSPSPKLGALASISGVTACNIGPSIGALIGYTGIVCSISIHSGASITSSVTSGGIASSTLTCPLFRLSASGTAQNYGSANLIAPSAQLGAQAQAYLIAPGARLTAIGTATVTATYEAYAVNLNHETKPGPAPIDETTRYTNFPFTHVVRYQNSYFGANSTGLYLLEGTTDDGTPIEWDIQTATTDFGTPQLKTVEMAFFGGRFGPAAEITLFAGETAGDPYVYTTPRDTTAKNYRQTFGRGLKARYYALAAKGADELVLDSITLNIANLARRI